MINSNQKANYYVIADHLRTTIFALADGAIFESKGRGYILKKLVKKATLLACLKGLDEKKILSISEKIIEVNSFYYTHLKKRKEMIISRLKEEIKKTIKFISSSKKELNKCDDLSKANAKLIFFWYDTKGIPLELIHFYLKKKNFKFPWEEFKKLLEKQKQKSRKDRKRKKISIF